MTDQPSEPASDDASGTPVGPPLLNDFGITPNVERLWRALITAPRSTTDDVAKRTGLAGAQLDAALAILVEEQLVRPADTPLGLVALDPTAAVGAHIVRAERQLTARLDELAQLRTRLPALAHDYARGRADSGDEPGFEILTDIDAVVQQIFVASDLTKHEHRNLIFRQTAFGLQLARDADLDLARRGVLARCIVGGDDLANSDLYAQLEITHGYGQHIRTLPTVPTRLIIADRDVAILPVDPDNAHLGAMFVRVRNLIDLLIFMFDRLWEDAVPLFEDLMPTEQVPTGRKGRVLELLSVGYTDQRIARTLGVGDRTIRREVAEIKEALGVTTRTEIAAAALRRRWM